MKVKVACARKATRVGGRLSGEDIITEIRENCETTVERRLLNSRDLRMSFHFHFHLTSVRNQWRASSTNNTTRCWWRKGIYGISRNRCKFVRKDDQIIKPNRTEHALLVLQLLLIQAMHWFPFRCTKNWGWVGGRKARWS